MYISHVMGPHIVNGKKVQWLYKSESPNITQLKWLISACMRIIIKTNFNMHCYSFRGSWYKQTDGGPISLRVTNSITKFRIADWASRVSRILSESKVKVYIFKSFVEDIRMGLGAIPNGSKWCKKVTK